MRIIVPLLLLLLVSVSCNRKPDVIWKVRTGAAVYASPSVSGDRIIAGSADANLYALDSKTGNIIWKRALEGRIHSKPLISGDRIYVGGGGRLYSVNADDGTILWSFDSGGLIEYDPCEDAGSVYFGSHSGKFYRVSKSGEKIWEFKARNKYTGNCSIVGQLVLTSCWDKNYYGIDRESGQPAWTVSSGNLNFAGPEIVGDTAWFATHQDMYNLEAQTGRILAKKKTTYLNFIVGADGFLWTNEYGLTKRSLEGDPIASVSFRSNAHFRPLFAEGLFILTDHRGLVGVSPELKVLWSFQAEDDFWSPGVVYQGVYYTGNRDSYVYAIRLPK